MLLMLGLALYDLSRSVLLREERPALVVPAPQPVRILLSGAPQVGGIHQINDADDLFSAINLANLHLSADLRLELLKVRQFEDGKCLKFQIVRDEIVAVDSGWMPAAMRIALAIPLRVERMTRSDWDDLPGVGPSLAQRIMQDRQINGEFGSFAELTRVKGIGSRRLDRWRPFFSAH